MSSESRAIAAFSGLGLVLVAVAVGLSHASHDADTRTPALPTVVPVAPGPSSSPAAPSGSAEAPKYPGLPSETPSTFTPTYDGFDYVRRLVDIPMRDGVKLHTVLVVPKGASRAPILLTRTPYNADKLTETADSVHMDVASTADAPGELLTSHGYIRVVQDVRGKYGSGRRTPRRSTTRPTPTTPSTGS
jgi:predicted acyl esterase